MQDKQSYYVVAEECQDTLIINKSKFITTLLPITDYDNAITKVKELSKKYNDATHNCYAFISNNIATEQKFSDDGEPQGTAGVPMLEVLKKRKVYMTLVVVTRYFGGVKLGSGGLISAYSSSVAKALDNARLFKMQESNFCTVECEYSLYNKLEELIIKHNAKILNTIFLDNPKIEFVIPSKFYSTLVDKVVDLLLGKAIISCNKTQFYGF